MKRTEVIADLRNVKVSIRSGGLWRDYTPTITTKLCRGEVLGVVGPNGSGKTLLTRALVGAFWPASLYQVSGEGAPVRRCVRVGYMPQSGGLLAWRGLAGNLSLPLRIPTKRDSDRYEALVDKLDLRKELSRLPTELSGGFQVRAAVARALVGAPDLLVLDEPTRNLDHGSTQVVLELIRAQAQEGAVWLVTHEPEDLLQVADRCLVLQGSAREYTELRDADLNLKNLVHAISHPPAPGP